MSSAPRFENQQIVNSLNLFVDSESAIIQGDTQSRGDDVHIQFEGNSVEAQDGEVIRLTLKEFSMPNTTYMIDVNNSRGIVKGASTFRPATIPVAPSTPLYGVAGTFDLLDTGNFDTIHRVAGSFAECMRVVLNLFVNPADVVGPPAVPGRAFTYSIFGPNTEAKTVASVAAGGTLTINAIPAPAAAASTTANFPSYTEEALRPTFGEFDKRILFVSFECKEIGGGSVDNPTGPVAAHGITNLKVQFPPKEGDIYQILGGLRMDGDVNNDVFNSLQIDFTNNPNIVSMKGYFPMTRFTEPSIFLRTNCGQNGLEMSVLQSGAIAGGNALIADVISSDILAKINRWSNMGPAEFINYNSQSDEYFVNIQQRKLTNLRLFLTDSKGRKLGRLTTDNESSGTAAGDYVIPAISPFDGGTPAYTSKRQNELGNMYFTAVLKIDVIKASCPSQLGSEIFQPPYPGSKSGGILPFTGYPEKPILRR